MGEAHLWSGGPIFTARGYCEALLVEGDRVLVAGTLADAQRLRATGTVRHELAGRTLIPGLVDAHLHLGELVLHGQGVPASAATSIEELLEACRRWAREHPVGPVIGRGWSFPSRPESAWPNRRDLDRAIAERPVILFHASGHAGVVNSAALERMGLDRSTRDPPGGRIGRERDGEPNGLLFETALTPASRLARERLTAEPRALGALTIQLARLGITSVGTMNTDEVELAVLRQQEATSPLSVRVRAYLALPWFANLDDRELRAVVRPGRRWSVGGIKGFADGAFGTRTALLSAPYADEPTSSGIPVHSTEELESASRRAHSFGLASAIHALGDLGLDRALQALERSRATTVAFADRIEHAGLVPPELLPRLRQVRPHVVVQPIFLWSDGWLADRLGPARCRWAYPFRTLLEAGLSVAGSSDAPFDALDPWVGMRAAIDRIDPSGRSANAAPYERLGVEAALALYTVGAGAALGTPGVGALAPGASADFVILDAPSLEAAVDRGASVVSETWLEGVPSFLRT